MVTQSYGTCHLNSITPKIATSPFTSTDMKVLDMNALRLPLCLRSLKRRIKTLLHMTTMLPHLPTEVIEEIVCQLPSYDVWSFVLTCRRFHAIGQRFLHRNIVIRSLDWIRLVTATLLENPELRQSVNLYAIEIPALNGRPPLWRGKHLKQYPEGSLESQMPSANRDSTDEDVSVLTMLSSLEHLKISSPLISYGPLFSMIEFKAGWSSGFCNSPTLKTRMYHIS